MVKTISIKTQNKKAGFTPAFSMIELVFVIVVLGILAGVAIPRLATTRDDAVLVKAKSQVSSIRSGISLLKNKRLLEGSMPIYPRVLDGNLTSTPSQVSMLFYGGVDGNILEYGLPNENKAGSWEKTSDNNASPITYDIHLGFADVTFSYDKSNGTFDCDHTDQNCKDLTE